jgi:hypothetical protein
MTTLLKNTHTKHIKYEHEKKLGRSLNFPFHYIGAVLSLVAFGDIVDHVYPNKVEIKDTYAVRPSSHIDLHLEKYSECRLRTKLGKGVDFNFTGVSFAFICSDIP